MKLKELSRLVKLPSKVILMRLKGVRASDKGVSFNIDVTEDEVNLIMSKYVGCYLDHLDFYMKSNRKPNASMEEVARFWGEKQSTHIAYRFNARLFIFLKD